MTHLSGKVAVVTGASRGVGRGIAIGLGEAGATVYVTGRTVATDTSDMPGTIHETAAAVTAAGGNGIAIQCDHQNDIAVQAVFEQVQTEQGRLDILVNNIWGGYEVMDENGVFTWERPFWEQPIRRWDVMFNSGARAHFTASRFAAPIMVAQRSGLIVNISYWAGQRYMNNIVYGASKAATDKLAKDMAHELRHYHVAAVSFYPGLVRTERVMAVDFFDLSNSESPEFSGRAIAALSVDPAIMQKSGHILVGAALALDYGLKDTDGKQPQPLTLETSA